MKNIAVIGCGMMGQKHILALRALGYPVKIVMGRDKEKTNKAASSLGILSSTTEFEDLISAGIEVVHVCTPPSNHYDIIKKALNAGMHVVTEKPFVQDVKEGEELVRLAKDKQLINAVGFNVRFHTACIKAEKLCKSQLGKVLLVNGSYMQEFHALPSLFSWRYQEGRSLATTEIGSHWVDLMRYLTGHEVVAVSATYGAFLPDRTVKDGMQYLKGSVEGTPFHTEIDNVALVTFRLADGALANMVLSEITPGRYNYLDITVTGSEGALWWNSEELNRFHVGKKNAPVEEHVLAFGGGFDDSIVNMLSEVYQDIENGWVSEQRRYADFADGLINAKICFAIYQSANNGSKWVEV